MTKAAIKEIGPFKIPGINLRLLKKEIQCVFCKYVKRLPFSTKAVMKEVAFCVNEYYLNVSIWT